MGMLVSLIYKMRLGSPQEKTYVESHNLVRYLMYLAGMVLIILSVSFTYFYKNLETSAFTITLMAVTQPLCFSFGLSLLFLPMLFGKAKFLHFLGSGMIRTFMS